MKLQTLEALGDAMRKTPENIKQIFGGITAWIGTVKTETPVQIKTAAKIIHLILEARARLAKSKSLGLDATATKVEFVEKWLGQKPNRRMMLVAVTLAHVPEAVFDTANLGILARFGKLAGMHSPTMKYAIQAAKAALVKGDLTEFEGIMGRVITVDGGTPTFVSAEDAATYRASSARDGSLAAARNLPLDELLALASAASLTADPALAARAQAHVDRIVEEFRATQGQATAASVRVLAKELNRKVAA